MSLVTRLYRGENAFDFVGRRKIWYLISAGLILLSVLSLWLRGLNLGIDFEGGAVFEFRAPNATVSQVESTVLDQDIDEVVVQGIGSDEFRVQTPPLENTEVDKVVNALARRFAVAPASISPSTVGAKWGGQITREALKGLVAFLLLVYAYISIRFEWKMATAAMTAVVHDLVITAGIYSLIGFQVTPSTVIALLTILGYSLYDTVVIFDTVRENTSGLAGGSRMSYSQAANLSLNQTVMRSINTSLTALIPVGVLLFVGVGLLGAGTLKDLALSLFVGLAASTYSSVFVATPILVDLKEREPQMQSLATRVASRRGTAVGVPPRLSPATAAAGAGTTSGGSARRSTAVERDLPDDDDDDPPASRPAAGAARASTRPPRPGQARKRKGGRGKSGKKRR